DEDCVVYQSDAWTRRRTGIDGQKRLANGQCFLQMDRTCYAERDDARTFRLNRLTQRPRTRISGSRDDQRLATAAARCICTVTLQWIAGGKCASDQQQKRN